MTETLHEPPPAAPPPPDPRRLVRDPDEKVVAGVCAAFGRYTDTDPVLWRVTVAVLTLFGGAGLALYALGWLLVPRTGQAQSAVERLVRRPDVSVGGVVVLVLGAVVVLALLDDGPGVGALLVVGGIAYLVSRERRAVGGSVDGAPTAPVDLRKDVPPPPAWTPPVPRPRSRLGGIVLSAAALVVGVLLALAAGGVDGITASRVVAAALLVVGAGLLVGTWYGRARWLIAVGALLVLVLGVTAAAEEVGVADGVGERRWTVEGSGAYSLGVGEGVLDLRGLQPGETASVAARVGAGQLTVLVPDDLAVDVVADVRLGELNLVGVDPGEGAPTSVSGRDVHEEFSVGSSADTAAGDGVDLDLEVTTGEVVLRRVER